MNAGLYGELLGTLDAGKDESLRRAPHAAVLWRMIRLHRLIAGAEYDSTPCPPDHPVVVQCDAASVDAFSENSGGFKQLPSRKALLDAGCRTRPTMSEAFLQTAAPESIGNDQEIAEYSHRLGKGGPPVAWGAYLRATDLLQDAPPDASPEECWAKGREFARDALGYASAGVREDGAPSTEHAGIRRDVSCDVRWVLGAHLYVAYASGDAGSTLSVEPQAALAAALDPEGRMALTDDGSPVSTAVVPANSPDAAAAVRMAERLVEPFWIALAALDDSPENRKLIPMGLLTPPLAKNVPGGAVMHRTLVLG